MLREFYPVDGCLPAHLPPELVSWMDLGRNLSGNGARPFVRDAPGRRLVVRRLPHPSGGHILLANLTSVERRADELRALDLSAREAQVLAWLSEGKSDSEISHILNVSERTIQKHLEHVFRKLGVSNRVKAALVAIEGAG